MALLHRPRVLFLDEPTVGADVAARRAILDTVRALADDGTAVVYTTHYLTELVDPRADVAILHEGRVVLESTVDRMLLEHARPTLAIITEGRRPELPGWHEDREWSPDVDGSPPGPAGQRWVPDDRTLDADEPTAVVTTALARLTTGTALRAIEITPRPSNRRTSRSPVRPSPTRIRTPPMLFSRSGAVARTSTRVLLADPAPLFIMVVLPLLFTAFLRPAMAARLQADGFVGATGAEQLIPGMAVLFAFLSTQTVCTLFYREHYWGTWERLRASGARGPDIMLGKAAPLLVLMLAQMALLFVVGTVGFGYRINGSLIALVALVVGLVICVLSYGLMVVALFRTLDQAMVVGNLGGMLLAGLGGALAPAESLPGWAQAFAHLTPTFWGLQGIQDVTLSGAALPDVAGHLAVLLGASALFVAVAALRFNPNETKIGST